MLLLVDSGVEVGRQRRRAGAASTLDVAVRAAGAVAEHYLVRGDRVGLRVLGLDRPQRRAHRRGAPAPAPGAGHAGPRRTRGEPRPRPGPDAVPGVRPGSIVLVFSPMLSQAAVAATTTLAARGLDVVVVDCLPERRRPGRRRRGSRWPGGCGCWSARRCWRGSRRTGIPVVAWRGPGTLDEVLRRLRPPRRAARRRAGGERLRDRRRAGPARAVQPAAAGAARAWRSAPRSCSWPWSRLAGGVFHPCVQRGRGAARGAGRAGARVARRRSGWWSTSAACGWWRTPAASTCGRWPRRCLLGVLHLACTLASYGPPGLRPRPRGCCALWRGRARLRCGAAVLVWLAARARGVPGPAARARSPSAPALLVLLGWVGFLTVRLAARTGA